MTEHHCNPAKKQQEQQQPPIQRQPYNSSNNYNLSNEIAAIRAQLLVLVSSLDRIEQQEMMMEHQKNM
jgi:hypothetical protein